MIKLNQSEVDNILDVLDEWYHCDTLGVKELEENEIGLNDNRYEALIKKLKRSEASPTIPKSMSWKGKAKNFPGAEEVIKQNGSK